MCKITPNNTGDQTLRTDAHFKTVFHWMTVTLMLVAAFNAKAQSMKPGLWQTTTKLTSTTGAMEKAMARSFESLKKLPKEERKALEARMTGLRANGNAIAMKLCVTAQAAQHTDPLPVEGGRDENGCTTADVIRTGNAIQASFFCPEGDIHGERAVELSATGEFLVRNISTVHVPVVIEGKPETVTTVTDTRFVSAACGTTRPLSKQNKPNQALALVEYAQAAIKTIAPKFPPSAPPPPRR